MCSFLLDILRQGSQTVQFRIAILFFFTFLTEPSSHPIANAYLFLNVFYIYKYTLLCCEQCVNVLMWVWANNLQSTLRLIFLVTGEPTPLSAVHWYTCVITIITIIMTIIIIFITIIIIFMTIIIITTTTSMIKIINAPRHLVVVLPRL